ncbi:unnamed protein product [Medioppia subpectinata]|uniref:PDZ domain-containing protein n=1 Tax=Medioppia subpectinata TaxID=1979941 RepID=A0A7R9L6V9_9ACAR|nr:unnamed protein product [Medioppia subpectinata]CAG2115386.1 unnamed protein product [Medioppia subpectinata]
MSALKASNESEVKALKALLKSSEDSMQRMTEEMESLRKQLITSEKSNQEMVAELSELSDQTSCLTQEISTLNAKNETEVQALKVQLKSSLDLMETMVTENNNLKQTVYSLSTLVSNMSNQNMAKDLKQKLCKMSTKNSELNEELSAPSPRLCQMIKRPDFDGYGFQVRTEKANYGHYISKVDADSPAQLAGLREGDRIIEVNCVNISNENLRQMGERIKSIPNETKLLVIDETTKLSSETLVSEESDRKCRELCEEMSALKASNESEVKALKAQLKSSEDSMETMTEEMESLRQQLITSEKRFCYIRDTNDNQEMGADLSEWSDQTSEELLALKASKHIIESEVNTSAQELNAQNIRHSVSDSSSSCSSIGSHNQLTTNSDKTRDEINSGEDETQMAEHKSLGKRYSDLVVTHEEYVSALESVQEESRRYRHFAIIEKNGLKQQCTQAIKQWDKALREVKELKEQLTRCKRQRDEALKEINQAMAVRIKAAKEMTRLAEENERALTALEGIRQLAEDSDDSESAASVGSHTEKKTMI